LGLGRCSIPRPTLEEKKVSFDEFLFYFKIFKGK